MNQMLMSVFGAMMRGESPSDFLKNLARTNPQLQGLNLDDLEGTAQAVCNQKGADFNQVAEQVKGFANSNKIF